MTRPKCDAVSHIQCVLMTPLLQLRLVGPDQQCRMRFTLRLIIRVRIYPTASLPESRRKFISWCICLGSRAAISMRPCLRILRICGKPIAYRTKPLAFCNAHDYILAAKRQIQAQANLHTCITTDVLRWRCCRLHTHTHKKKKRIVLKDTAA